MLPRPTTQRDTSVRTPGEALVRLAFIAYLVSLPAGAGLLIWGGIQARPFGIMAGAACVTVFGLLHFLARRRLEFAQIVQELKRNPFKNQAHPEGGEDRQAGCGKGGCRR